MGDLEGLGVFAEGDTIGIEDGKNVGFVVGDALGTMEGIEVVVGCTVGSELGIINGDGVGATLGPYLSYALTKRMALFALSIIK